MTPPLTVVSSRSQYPFSKGLLTKSITASGIEPSIGYQMAQELESELLEDRIEFIDKHELYQRVISKIEKEHGKEVAQQYQTASRIKKSLDRPVIVYLGGAVGIGKSTVSTELASRLPSFKVTSTDTIRQIMRLVFSPDILPAIHVSSFQTDHLKDFRHLGSEERLLAGFRLQASNVCVGVKAVVERAIVENVNTIIEGVHLLPDFIRFPHLKGKAYHIPIVLELHDPEAHKDRFQSRITYQTQRHQNYLEHFKNIRCVHDCFVEQGKRYRINIIDNDHFDIATNQIVQIIIGFLQKQLRRDDRKLNIH